ncbi:hypothetical protein [Okeania sp. SIO2G5]|uniref:hypothetical protein n=1 Tax=Okeania sp. SIO2G5 TaxID=2607796 RepID=UPI0013C0AACA|nr:hypothetical protein [Okeania sp. SIO2G5]NEP76144.1 hypothetical protein [Okeania sp. SIO2G5]
MKQLQPNKAITHALITNRDYDFRYCREGLNVVCVPGKNEASELLKQHGSIMRTWPGRTFVKYGNREIEVSKGVNSMNDIMQVNGLTLTVPVIEMVRDIHQIGKSCGVVRLSDDWQCIVFDGKKHNNEDGKFLIGHSIDTTTTWKRKQYYSPESYELMQQFLRDEMSVGSEWKEFSYTVRDPEGDTNVLTHRLVTDFKLVDDGLGNYYHWGQNRIIEPIE